MSLAKVMEEIKKVKPYINEDVEAGPIETLSGRRGRKNQAIASMERLKREYRTNLLESSVFIIVAGTANEEFATIAKEKFGCFSSNPNSIYEDLAERIPETIYKGKSDVANLFDILRRHLEDKAHELDIVGYPLLNFRQEYRVTLKNKDDLVDLIRRAINDQVGSEITGLQAVTSLVDKAIEKEHDKKVTSIILPTNDEKLALDLLSTLGRLHPRGVVLATAGKTTKVLKTASNSSTKEVTEETVAEVLKNIGSNLKK